MAVNRPDLIWSTYQDKQLEALTKISRDIDKITRFSADYMEDISEIFEDHAKSLITAINDIWNDNYTTIDKYVPYIHRDSRRTAENTQQTAENVEELGDQEENQHRQQIHMLSSLNSLLENLDIEGSVMRAIDSANAFSDLYNSIIVMTGASGQEAQTLRRELINQVEELNDDIGNKLNPTAALQTMIAMSNNANISNLETLRGIADPILLAQETMNISLSSLAETSARMYTKYNFSSSKLEKMIDNIRNSTEGQDVSADLIVSTIASLEDTFAIASNGDVELLEKMNNSMIRGVSFLESSYIDSQTFTSDLESFLSPDVRERNQMFRKYGSDYASQIMAAAEAGQLDVALDLQRQALDSMDIQEALKRGFSKDEWMDVNSEFKNADLEEYLANIDENGSMRESAEEKFLTVQEQISNSLNSVTSYLATIQERVGIGFSDVAAMYLLWDKMNLGDIFSGSLSRSGLSFTGSAASRGLATSLGGLGTALGVGAAVGGVALLLTNLYKTVKDHYDTVGDPYQDALESKDTGYGYGFRGKYNAETGETDWSYSAFESQEEADSYDAEATWDAYIKDKKSNRTLWQKISDALLTGAWNSSLGPHNYDATSTSLYEDTEEQIYEAIQKIEGADSAVRSFYASRNLLDDQGEILHFAQNLGKYEDYYEQGMYYDKSKKKWFYVADDSPVIGDKAPKSFDVGTNYVTRDQLALIHEGEAITPKEYNPAANMNELETLRSRDREQSQDIAEMLTLISAIKDLVETWKRDTEKQSLVTKGRNATALRNVSSYFTTY